MDFDVWLFTSAMILYPWEGLVDSQALNLLPFQMSVPRHVYASVACMLCMLGHVTHDCNSYYVWLFGAF